MNENIRRLIVLLYTSFAQGFGLHACGLVVIPARCSGIFGHAAEYIIMKFDN